MAGGLPGNAALTLLRCRRRRARPDLGDSAKDVERQRYNYGLMALVTFRLLKIVFDKSGNCSVIAGLLKSIFNKEW
jgi:hypothetical protein